MVQKVGGSASKAVTPLSPFTMTSNILEIPFRRTQTVKLSTAIKSYIESKFDQQPAVFEDDCREIERLREDAVHITEPHVSGIEKLNIYVAQLRYMVS